MVGAHKVGSGANAHLWADAIAELLDGAGEQIVWRPDFAPNEATLALMGSLGVRVDAEPTVDGERRYRALHRTRGWPRVSGQTAAAARDVKSGIAAQDYRASIASVHRREQAGDEAVICGSCGTETDVSEIRHSPSCASYVAPALAAPAKTKADGPGQPEWEKGRSGRRRSTRERNAAGELSSGEMQRRHETVFDAQPTLTSCAFDGCEWRFEGTALACRDAAAAHRAEQHPDAGKGKRTRLPKPGQTNAQAGLAALEAMDAGRPQPRADIAADISAADTAPARSTPASAGARKWTRATIVEAIKAWAEEHGRPPTSADWVAKDPAGKRPTASGAIKTHGPWSSLLVDAGFPAKPGRPAVKASEPEPLAQQPPAREASGQASSGDRLASPEPPAPNGELGSGSEIYDQLAGNLETLRAEADRLNDIALEAGRKRDAIEQLIESIEGLAA